VRRFTPSTDPHTRCIPSNEAPTSYTARAKAARGGVAFPAPPLRTACRGSVRFCRRLACHWGHREGRLPSHHCHKAFRNRRYPDASRSGQIPRATVQDYSVQLQCRSKVSTLALCPSLPQRGKLLLWQLSIALLVRLQAKGRQCRR